jgi:hypothetical protein
MKKKALINLLVFVLVYSNITGQVNPEVTPALLNPVTNVAANKITSNATLNVFFANKLNTYLSEASDISTSKAYALLDNADGRLFIGGTFNPTGSLTQFKRLLITAGAKANVKDGFAGIFSNKEFNNDIGFSLKFTVVGKGTISYDPNPNVHKNKVASKRAYLQNKFINDIDEKVTAEKVSYGAAITGAITTQFVADETETAIEEFAKEEATYITTKKLFNTAYSWWLTFDGYCPVTKSEYDIVADLKKTVITTEGYKPWQFNIVYSNFWEKNKWGGKIPLIPKGTTLLTFKGAVVGNNSVLAEMLDSYSYDKYLVQAQVIDTQFLAKLKTTTVYNGKFEKFVTARLSGRCVYMPFGFIGISAAAEKNFGTLDNLNWRLGIPFSLKDNEGKTKVNFEVVWKEVQKNHTIGLSIGLPIGKDIF